MLGLRKGNETDTNNKFLGKSKLSKGAKAWEKVKCP